MAIFAESAWLRKLALTPISTCTLFRRPVLVDREVAAERQKLTKVAPVKAGDEEPLSRLEVRRRADQ